MLTSIFTTATLTLPTILLCIATAALLGFIIALVFGYKSEMTQSFALSLMILPVAVSVVITLVNGNIGAGVAVAGAFALVRFRSAQGTAREITALFTTMAVGMACGMGYLAMAGLLTLFAIALVWLVTVLHFKEVPPTRRVLRIVMPEEMDYSTDFDDVFAAWKVKPTLQKVKTVHSGKETEVSWLVTFPDAKIPKAFLKDLQAKGAGLSIAVSAPEEHSNL